MSKRSRYVITQKEQIPTCLILVLIVLVRYTSTEHQHIISMSYAMSYMA